MDWLNLVVWPALTAFITTSSVGFIIAVRYLFRFGPDDRIMLGQAGLWPLGLTLLLLHYSGHA